MRTSSGAVAGGDPVDHGRHDGHRVPEPGGQVFIDEPGQVADDPLGQRAVAGRVVAGHERERARAGPPPGRDPGDQARGSGAHDPGRVVAQRLDVGLDLGPAGVEAAVGAAEVPGLGHRDRDHGQLGSLEVAQPRIVVVRRVGSREAAQHLEPVCIGGA